MHSSGVVLIYMISAHAAAGALSWIAKMRIIIMPSAVCAQSYITT